MVTDNNGNYTPPDDQAGYNSQITTSGKNISIIVPMQHTRPGAWSTHAELRGNILEAEKYIPIARQQLFAMHQQNVNGFEIISRPVDLGEGKRMTCQRMFNSDKAVIDIPTKSSSSWNGIGPDPSTRQVYIRLSWGTYADIDLWVTDPCGNKVYYGNKESTCQNLYGFLDVDANAGNYTISPVEIISWVTAPKGEYVVQIDYFADHEGSTGSVDYTVYAKGVGTFSGTLINAPSAKTKTITTFTI